MGKILAACFFLAAQTYAVPPAVLLGIYQVESGEVGKAVGPNSNGSYDLGPMQINSLWLPELADEWGVDIVAAEKRVRDDPCVNVTVAAWILKKHISETDTLTEAIAYYHSRTPHRGTAYKNKVVANMEKYGLVGTD